MGGPRCFPSRYVIASAGGKKTGNSTEDFKRKTEAGLNSALAKLSGLQGRSSPPKPNNNSENTAVISSPSSSKSPSIDPKQKHQVGHGVVQASSFTAPSKELTPPTQSRKDNVASQPKPLSSKASAVRKGAVSAAEGDRLWHEVDLAVSRMAPGTIEEHDEVTEPREDDFRDSIGLASSRNGISSGSAAAGPREAVSLGGSGTSSSPVDGTPRKAVVSGPPRGFGAASSSGAKVIGATPNKAASHQKPAVRIMLYGTDEAGALQAIKVWILNLRSLTRTSYMGHLGLM